MLILEYNFGIFTNKSCMTDCYTNQSQLYTFVPVSPTSGDICSFLILFSMFGVTEGTSIPFLFDWKCDLWVYGCVHTLEITFGILNVTFTYALVISVWGFCRLIVGGWDDCVVDCKNCIFDVKTPLLRKYVLLGFSVTA